MLQTGFWTPSLPPQTDYRIDCRVLPGDSSLEGTETIRVTNTTPHPLRRLAVEWPGSEVGEIRFVGVGQAPRQLPTPLRTHAGPLLYELPEAADPGESFELELEFTHPLSGSGDSARTVVNWHPRLWWGFPAHASYDVAIDVPERYALGASGRADPASGRFHAAAAQAFGFFLGKDHIVETADAGETQVRSLFTQTGRDCGQLLLETAVDAIQFYRKRFGLFPYDYLTILPGAPQPMGGYPAATGLIVVHGQERFCERPEVHWRWITAHEIGHQYWGEYVLNDDPTAWLPIGLGIYADREYALARGLGSGTHEGLMARYVDGVRQHLDTTVAIPLGELDEVEFDFNNVVTHGKGFSIVSALACVLGREAFKRIFLRCLAQFAGRRLGPSEFQAVCEAESQQDLSWFFSQWLRTGSYVSYEIESQCCVEEEGGYETEVQVVCKGTLKMPMPVQAVFTDGSRQIAFTDRLLDACTVRFRSRTPLAEATIDPEQEVAQVVPPPDPTEQDLARQLRVMPWRGAGEAAVCLFRDAQDVEPQDGRFWGRLGLRLYDDENYGEALDAFTKAADLSEPGSDWVFAALVWQGHILDLTGRRAEALGRYEQARAVADGCSMLHSQYNLRTDADRLRERLATPFCRE